MVQSNGQPKARCLLHPSGVPVRKAEALELAGPVVRIWAYYLQSVSICLLVCEKKRKKKDPQWFVVQMNTILSQPRVPVQSTSIFSPLSCCGAGRGGAEAWPWLTTTLVSIEPLHSQVIEDEMPKGASEPSTEGRPSL